LGNIETDDIGTGLYDVIIAESVFEHVPDWRTALAKIYAALKPGGVFYFQSSNKFAFVSGDFRGVPLYGWLPYRVRLAIRSMTEGPRPVPWAMDNQFTYGSLRKYFRGMGFIRVVDYLDTVDPDDLNSPTPFRRFVARVLKSSVFTKGVALTFWPVTMFVCVK
jgi:SAM-dependent methyltransferase